jgi:predicted RNA-binding Zn ribbon-like protein
MVLTLAPGGVRSQLQLDQDSKRALEEAVALVNSETADDGDDILASVEALGAFLDERGISGSRDGTGSELRSMRRLRRRLREVFERAADGDVDAAVGGLNQLIADAHAVPYLIEHDGNPLHLHYTPADAPLHHRMGAELAIALAVVVRDGGLDRLRVCDSPDCRSVFVDLSRNRSRRYCDTLCANRQHVAAYRQRQALGARTA